MSAHSQSTIDPLALARFLVLPGAVPLLEAFAAIPPGPLRDSVIHHAQVIAATYSGAPPEAQMADPLQSLGPMAYRPPPAAPGAHLAIGAPPPQSPGPATGTVESEVVKLSLQGVRPQDIAKRLGISASTVYAAKREARDGGVEFPSMMGVPTTGGGKKLKGGKTRFNGQTFHVSMDTVNSMALGQMVRAANQRGITVEEYLDRRKRTIEQAMQRVPAFQIAFNVGEEEKSIKNWLSQARGTGLNIPYADHIPTAEVAPPPPRYTERWDEVKGGGKSAILRAAAARGLTPEAYCDLRESILQARMAGVSGALIAQRTGETYTTVKDIIAYGSNFLRLELPPITEGPRVAA